MLKDLLVSQDHRVQRVRPVLKVHRVLKVQLVHRVQRVRPVLWARRVQLVLLVHRAQLDLQVHQRQQLLRSSVT